MIADIWFAWIVFGMPSFVLLFITGMIPQAIFSGLRCRFCDWRKLNEVDYV